MTKYWSITTMINTQYGLILDLHTIMLYTGRVRKTQIYNLKWWGQRINQKCISI